ncbi:MAG: lysophospholipid acyltransferase family protein [Anaerolineae bacterium]
MWLQRILRPLFRGLMAVLLDYRIEGLDHVPGEGPVLVAINHSNFWDAVLPTVVLPRYVVGMAKIELFRTPVLGQLLRLYGACPVRRGQVDRQALTATLTALGRGEVVSMAPEGTRGKDHRLQKGRPGLAFLAAKSGAPVLPFAVSGSERFWGRVTRLRRTRVKISIGPPFRLLWEGDKIPRSVLREMTDEAMFRIAALLPEEYRGRYSDLETASTNYLSFDRA